MPKLPACLLAFALSGSSSAALAQSHWAALNAQGTLVYGHFKTGDRIADFSFAGYRAGGVALPAVTTKLTVAPSGKDDTSAIQKAIDEVSKLPLVDGHRGAVELAPGAFHCSGTLNINASGVVLRGAGETTQGSTITMTGSPHLALEVRGHVKVDSVGKTTHITDTYVPSGTTSFQVADASGFRAGDTLLIVKPVTDAWVHMMGMDILGVRNGKKEHWVDGDLPVRRRIASVSGNTVTVEVPFTDSIDTKYLAANSISVTKVEVTGQIAEVGVESLRIVAPARSVDLGVTPEYDGLKLEDAVDSWLRSVAFEETTNSVDIGHGVERVTVLQSSTVQHVPVSSSAKPFDFSCNGTQILFDRCTGSGDSVFYVATQRQQQGPVVVLHCRFTGNGHIQPHQRWSTGLLVDSSEVPGGGIDLMNRGMMGTGHGWAIGWSVVWNSQAQSFNIQQPPAAENWSIGNRGEELDEPMPVFGGAAPVPLRQGIVESPNQPVQPPSLYLQQLQDRLGPAALKNIGY